MIEITCVCWYYSKWTDELKGILLQSIDIYTYNIELFPKES